MTKLKDNSTDRDLAKLFSDHISKQDAGRIGQLMESDSSYEADFLRTSSATLAAKDLIDDEDIRKLLNEDSLPASKKRSFWISTGIAAAFLIAATFALQNFLPWGTSNQAESLQRYATRIGEQKTFSLSDGSTLTLNTGTVLRVQINDNFRKVILDKGEAFFDIEKDEQRPFSVDLGEKTISVLGTQFNIRKQPESFTMALVEGVVALHNSDEPLSATSTAIPFGGTSEEQINLNPQSQQTIKAGWVVSYNQNNQTLLAQQDADISRRHAWTNGFIPFSGESLVNLVNELNRYSGKKILIGDSSIMDLQVYAGIRVDQIDQTLKALEMTLPIRIEQDFDRVLILGSDKNR
ncbi:FecR domain-containing protein [Porticoccaceae bacterium LTM1]|nr:FecR domain-containing protein [Porticoccaceae bacterium LTM1]